MHLLRVFARTHTNVWIDLYRGERAAPEGQQVANVLDTLLVHDGVFTWGVVETELYQGVRDDERMIREAKLDALNFLETNREDYCAAGNVFDSLRWHGTTIPMIAALTAAVFTPLPDATQARWSFH